jgi:hypothetical protein
LTIALRKSRLCDGDVDILDEYIERLPGDVPPELVVFSDSAVVSHFSERYDIKITDLLSGVGDHHSYAKTIANKLTLTDDYVSTDACRIYAASRDKAEFDQIKKFLNSTLSDRR